MVIEMDLLPPRWIDVQEEVSELLAEIAQNSAQLDKLHQKHLLPGFGDEDLRRQDEGVIERLTQDITRSFHECQRSIMRIETMVAESKAQGAVTSGEETMAKNIQISLAARVQEASARFRKKQSTYLRSMRSLLSCFSFVLVPPRAEVDSIDFVSVRLMCDLFPCRIARPRGNCDAIR
jgi:syntaxin 16